MEKRKKLNISNFFKRSNVKRFFIFLIIAFVFLLFSKLSSSYKQNIRLKVSLTQLDDEVKLENDSLNYVTAYVEANGFALVPLLFKSSMELKLDVKEDVALEPNQFVFDVEKNQYLIAEQLGKSYALISVKPKELVLPYSKIANKKVPIKIKHNIKYATGFDLLGDFSLSVDSAKIVGSAETIAPIKSLNTELLELEDVKSDILTTVKINGSKYKNVEVYPKSVEISGNIERFTEGTAEVLINIINKPADVAINYFPKTLDVTYYVDLARYKTVEPSDFVVECDFNEVDSEQRYLIPKIVKQPDFVKRVKLKQNRIDYIKL
ncbi:YbbR-like domain-containing protein [Winogradskyella ursingii]|uniref:hypothetical protein n=1 Tax=Winogradskyella ursingii TaxID=2686079 RepID=UPI0015C721C4|nr:hypothetical protein [Winogradskyella ursingii]